MGTVNSKKVKTKKANGVTKVVKKYKIYKATI